MRSRFWLLLALLNLLNCGAEPLQRWLYLSQNLWPEENMSKVEDLFRRASKAGYTHVLLSDSKFSKLDEMDTRYFRHVDRLKTLAKELHLEIVPALFPVGYSNDLLWHDPNLVEALPIEKQIFEVHSGEARLLTTSKPLLKGGDFSDLKQWSWFDPSVANENGTAAIKNLKGDNARIVQKLSLVPFHQYHFTVRVKTDSFVGKPEVKILAGDQSLDFNDLGVANTQDWKTHHVVFNSLNYTNANLYLGTWGGNGGSLWFDDATLEECALVNLVRRPGAPLVIRNDRGQTLVEGKDYQPLSDPKMGNRLWKGSYDIWHEPPVIKTSLPDGTKVLVSYYHAVTVNDDQANICPSEPKTIELLRDQARRMHAAWGANGYMMSHDEIRVLNWCHACVERGLNAGALLADNVKTCIQILREVNPGGRIYVWSDMFDPNHNAHDNYYLVRGNLAGSWEGLDKDVVIVPWYFEKRRESLKFFSDRGHHQIIAGYYDHSPEQILKWLQAAEGLPGIDGVMYTTWQSRFSDLERFSTLVGSENK